MSLCRPRLPFDNNNVNVLLLSCQDWNFVRIPNFCRASCMTSQPSNYPLSEFCYSYRAFSYIQYIDQQMHVLKYNIYNIIQLMISIAPTPFGRGEQKELQVQVLDYWIFFFFFKYCTYRAWCKIQFIRPTLHALKCEHYRCTVFLHVSTLKKWIVIICVRRHPEDGTAVSKQVGVIPWIVVHDLYFTVFY
jgi:hypothetical protein